MATVERDWPRFIVQTQPIRFESVTGFISRALAPTAISNFNLALRLADVSVRFGKLNDIVPAQHELHRLAYLFGTRPSEIRKLAVEDAVRVWDHPNLQGEPVRLTQKSLSRSGIRRVSPQALREANFHRMTWDRSIYSFDPETLEQLIHVCPACNQPLGWRRSGDPHFCDSCIEECGRPYTDLREFSSAAVECGDFTALRFFSDLIVPRSSGAIDRLRSSVPNGWHGAPPRALGEIAITMAKLTFGHRSSQGLPLPIEVVAGAGRALLGGPERLREELKLLKSRHDLAELSLILKRTSNVAQEIFKSALPSVHTLRHEHASVAEVDLVEHIVRRPDIEWRLKKVVNVDRVTRRAVRDLRSDPPYLRLLAASNEFSEVCDYLGLEDWDLQILIQQGFLKKLDPTLLPPLCSADRVMTGSLRLFLDQVWGVAIEAREVRLKWIQFVSVHRIWEQNPGLSWASLLVALFRSGIARFWRPSHYPCWYHSLSVLDGGQLANDAWTFERMISPSASGGKTPRAILRHPGI